MNGIEIRTCTGCRKSEIVYRDGAYNLFKYGVRHYAHGPCLAKRFGTDAARAQIPEHQRRWFDASLLDADEWDCGLIDVKDAQIERAKAASERAKSAR